MMCLPDGIWNKMDFYLIQGVLLEKDIVGSVEMEQTIISETNILAKIFGLGHLEARIEKTIMKKQKPLKSWPKFL